MNSETERAGRLLCRLRLSRKGSNESLVAEIHNPRPFVTHPPLAPEPVRDWGSVVTIRLNDVQHCKTIYGANWLGSFLLALSFVQAFIPRGEESEWIDDEGVESWCVLPRIIPFGWGYELYSQIARMSDNAEQEFIEGIEARRIARKRMAGGDSSEEPGTG